MRRSLTKFALATALVGGVSFGMATNVSAAAEECVPEEVDASEYFVDGELDLEAYLAAVAAAAAECEETAAPGGGNFLPATGSESSNLLPFGVTLVGVGAAAVIVGRQRRQRSA
jgi:LPXTG-motif cell wall-anchored protein